MVEAWIEGYTVDGENEGSGAIEKAKWMAVGMVWVWGIKKTMFRTVPSCGVHSWWVDVGTQR